MRFEGVTVSYDERAFRGRILFPEDVLFAKACIPLERARDLCNSQQYVMTFRGDKTFQ